MVSELWDGSHEVQILEHLSHGPASHPGKKHIIELLDQFKHEGMIVEEGSLPGQTPTPRVG